MKFSLRKASQVAVILVSGATVAWIIIDNYAGFWAQLVNADFYLLFPGFIFLILSRLVGWYTWKLMMSYLGYPLSFFRSMKLVALFQVASYIPGGIWQFVGISYWAEEDDIPKKVTAVGTGINEASALLVATMIFFGVVPLYLPLDTFSSYIPLVLIVPSALFVLHPRIFYTVLNYSLEVIGRKTLEPLLDYSQLLGIFLVKLSAWSVRAISFYFIMNAFYDAGRSIIPLITALYAGAWALGLLVFFVPGGLGVREITGISFLSFVVPETVATVFLIMVRLMVFFMEFLSVGLFLLISEKLDVK